MSRRAGQEDRPAAVFVGTNISDKFRHYSFGGFFRLNCEVISWHISHQAFFFSFLMGPNSSLIDPYHQGSGLIVIYNRNSAILYDLRQRKKKITFVAFQPYVYLALQRPVKRTVDTNSGFLKEYYFLHIEEHISSFMNRILKEIQIHLGYGSRFPL